MEILVATLAYTVAEHNANVLARIQFLADKLQGAPGLISSRFYRNRGHKSYYLLFTTWEDEESWQKAQEQHNPKTLLRGSTPGLFPAPPEQWHMQYLWGYSRPTATASIAAAHLASVPPNQADFSQQEWLHGLNKHSLKSRLGFAFLARGNREEASPRREHSPFVPPGLGEHIRQQGSIFLNLFSWASEAEREAFYLDTNYQALDSFVRSVGVMYILPLEPM